MFVNPKEILGRMNPNQKVNYDRIMQKMINRWTQTEERPKILLHSCCAPCSTATLEYLCAYADVTIYFSNSNIHPRSEYERRMKVQIQFIDDFNEVTGNQVHFLSDAYQPLEYLQKVKGLEEEPEGGARCSACFELRLDHTAEKAKELDFDYFGSALTLSPKKNSQIINGIGLEVQELFDVNYLPSDFKKNNGYKRSIEMCDEYNVYRQCYCGCIFAAKQQGLDLKTLGKDPKEVAARKAQREARRAARSTESEETTARTTVSEAHQQITFRINS